MQRYERKKEKVIVTSVAVGKIKFLFGMCSCIINSDAGTNDFCFCWLFWMFVDTHMFDCMCLWARTDV